MKTTKINEPVTVTAMGFRKNLKVYPKRIELNGSSYSFIDAGLRCLVQNGNKIIAEIFTMSDGQSEYRIRNTGGGWTLLSIAQ